MSLVYGPLERPVRREVIMQRRVLLSILAGWVVCASAAAGKAPAAGAGAPATARIFYLASGGRVVSANPDGSDVTVVAKSRASGPDGIAVDVAGGHIYWTTMGAVSANDGTIER